MKRTLLTSLALLAAFGASLQAGTKLSKAAINGDIPRMEERLKAGEKVSEIDKWGWTALHWATYYGQKKAALWLLEQGADPNLLTTDSYGRFKPGMSVLMLAAYYGHAEIVEALLQRKVDASLKDHQGYTALDRAKEFKFDECVKLLEAAGK